MIADDFLRRCKKVSVIMESVCCACDGAWAG